MSEAYELVSLRGGALGIRSLEYGEVCHPGVGPAAEAHALYVEGLDLATRRETLTGPFRILDVGLGGAANALAVLHAAVGLGGEWQMVSFDRTLGSLDFALRHAESLGYFGPFREVASQVLKTGEADWSDGRTRVRWKVELGDFTRRMADAPDGAFPAHAILFDPHSPATNPEMWTLPTLRGLRRCLQGGPPASLATYSRSTAIRVTFLLAGWWVGRGRSTPTKEETTMAATEPGLLRDPLGPEWLERVRRSGAAQPWVGVPHQPGPIAPEWLRALAEHPQFRRERTP